MMMKTLEECKSGCAALHHARHHMHEAKTSHRMWPVCVPHRKPSSQRVVVVGAGPTGLLTAMYLARRGYIVEVHEKAPSPEVRQMDPQQGTHNYPIILSSRALLAFRELQLQTSFFGPSAPQMLGTWDVVAGTLQPGHPEDANARTILVDRKGEGDPPV